MPFIMMGVFSNISMGEEEKFPVTHCFSFNEARFEHNSPQVFDEGKMREPPYSSLEDFESKTWGNTLEPSLSDLKLWALKFKYQWQAEDKKILLLCLTPSIGYDIKDRTLFLKAEEELQRCFQYLLEIEKKASPVDIYLSMILKEGDLRKTVLKSYSSIISLSLCYITEKFWGDDIEGLKYFPSLEELKIFGYPYNALLIQKSIERGIPNPNLKKLCLGGNSLVPIRPYIESFPNIEEVNVLEEGIETRESIFWFNRFSHLRDFNLCGTINEGNRKEEIYRALNQLAREGKSCVLNEGKDRWEKGCFPL